MAAGSTTARWRASGRASRSPQSASPTTGSGSTPFPISTMTNGSTGCSPPQDRSGASPMRLLFLGDVVGRSGRQAVVAKLPGLRARYKLDFVAVNAENAAGGFGITEAILNDLIHAGADVVP